MTLADLVPDSEDEEYLFRSKEPLRPPKPVDPPKRDPPTTATMTDNAVASTSRGDTRAEPEPAPKKPRPKPRKKPPTGSTGAAPFAPPSDFASITTPVRRDIPTTALQEPVSPAESPRPQDIPLTIADRAKSRVRAAKSKPVAQDIIDIPSDDDEQLLRLSPLRPKQTEARRTKNRLIPNPPPPSIHPSQESLVTPTSDFQLAPVASSQLPPSDPPSSTLPLPTSTPESAKRRRQVATTDGADKSPLNPSKRKRQRVAMADDEDNQTHDPPPHAVAAADEPPPNFFASSSSLPPPPAPLVRGNYGKKEPPAKRTVLNDDAPLLESVDPDPPREKKGRPKPKRKTVTRPEPDKARQSSPLAASTSRSRTNAKAPAYKSAEIIDDSDEEAGPPALPPPPHQPESQSPLSDLSKSASPGAPERAPSSNRKRPIPEVVITTVPRKRTSSPLVREAEEMGGVNGSPKGKKRQKKAVEEDYFDGLDDELEVAPKKGSRSRAKAPQKGKRRTKGAADDGELEKDPADDVTGTGKKAKTKAKTRATAKTKSAKSGKPRVVESDDEAATNAGERDSEAALVVYEEAIESSVIQPIAKEDKTPPQDTTENQENTPPPPNPIRPKSTAAVTPSSVTRRTPAPTSASSFSRLNYGHSLANEEKPMTMAEIIQKANSATGTPSGIKSYSSFMKGSRSTLRKIAPLHARRKTPPPLPPKPPPPKKTKKQLELEEKWEEELEETIEGWAALSSQERELLRKQKRDMEMGFED